MCPWLVQVYIPYTDIHLIYKHKRHRLSGRPNPRRLGRGRVARHEGLALRVAEDAALTTAALGQQAPRREDS